MVKYRRGQLLVHRSDQHNSTFTTKISMMIKNKIRKGTNNKKIETVIEVS
jgi:hypothetical protein